jgi:hypothetical protein
MSDPGAEAPAESRAIALGFATLGLAAALAVLARGSRLAIGVGVATIAAAGYVLVRHGRRRDSPLGLVLGLALVARLTVVGLDTHLGLFPKADALVYHFRASTLADAWWAGEGWQHMNNLKTASYEIVVAPLYFWFGADPLLARVLNSVLATAAAYNVYRVGETIFSRTAGVAGAGAFALLPSLVRVHGEHLREAWLILLVTQIVYVLVADELDRPLPLILVAVCAGFVVFVRRPTFLVLLAPIALALVFQASDADVSRATGARVGLLGGLAALGAGLWTRLKGGDLFYLDRLSPEALSEFRRPWARGDSSYLTDIAFSNWLEVLAFLPVGALYFLLVPFPWQLNNTLAALALAENMLLYYPLVLLALPAFANVRENRGALVLASFLLVGSVLYGLIEGNVGTVLRHRAQFTWVVFLFAGQTITRWWQTRDVDETTAREAPT